MNSKFKLTFIMDKFVTVAVIFVSDNYAMTGKDFRNFRSFWGGIDETLIAGKILVKLGV